MGLRSDYAPRLTWSQTLASIKKAEKNLGYGKIINFVKHFNEEEVFSINKDFDEPIILE